MRTYLRKIGFEIEGEFHEDTEKMMEKYGDIGTDGSVSRCSNHSALDDLNCREFRSNPIESKKIKQADEIFDLLKIEEEQGKYHWNNSCGFHVHVSFSTALPPTLISSEFVYFFQEGVEKAFPKQYRNRRENSYCKHSTQGDAENLESELAFKNSEKYRAVNYSNLFGESRRTIEFRIFPGDSAKKLKEYLQASVEITRDFLKNEDKILRRSFYLTI